MNSKIKRRMTPKVFVSELGPVIEKLVKHQDFSVLTKKEQKILERFNNRFQKRAIRVSNTEILSDWISVGDKLLYLYFKNPENERRSVGPSVLSSIIYYKVEALSPGSRMMTVKTISARQELPENLKDFNPKYKFQDLTHYSYWLHRNIYSGQFNTSKYQIFQHRWYRIPKWKFPGKQRMNNLLKMLEANEMDVSLALTLLQSCSEPLRHNNYNPDWDEMFYELPKRKEKI